jgi:hypothetical protein
VGKDFCSTRRSWRFEIHVDILGGKVHIMIMIPSTVDILVVDNHPEHSIH